jgi:tetratricopeptide (TPR) repeat protein
MSKYRIDLRFLVPAMLLLVPSIGAAQAPPTDAEFWSWPSYCQARFVTVPAGWSSEWVSKISSAQIAAAKAQIGEDVFMSIHHACAGKMWLDRSRTERDPKVRAFMLNEVLTETSYTVARVPNSSILLPQMYSWLAEASRGLGRDDRAIDYLERAVSARPEDPQSYVLLGLLYRRLGDFSKAKATFLRGVTATDGGSPELNYNFGLVLLQMKDYPAALERAKLAYDAGFPLPGLRNKLRALGYWPTANASAAAATPR